MNWYLQPFPVAPKSPTSLGISVTEGDICKGQKGTTQFCPIALALHNQLSQRQWVRVWVLFDALYVDNLVLRTTRRFSLPPEARQFIIDFEEGKEVSPFVFTATES